MAGLFILFRTILSVTISWQLWEMFEILDHKDCKRGKIMVATEDILPGTELFQELSIIHNYSTDFARESFSYSKQMLTGIQSRYWDAYYEFNKLSKKNKKKVLTLFGPATACLLGYDPEDLKKVDMPTEEMDMFIKLTKVLNMNSFGDREKINLFEKSSRQSHSCLPNCAILVKENKCFCRVILPVKAGDELTNCYNHKDYFDKPIYVGRDYYLLTKGFYCRCVRCEGPGDDTRQFDCCDSKCAGQHWTCQPNSQAIPYLLPCTVCGKVPPEDFQQEMFEIEKQLPAMSALATQVRLMMPGTLEGAHAMPMHEKKLMLDRLLVLKYPSAHRLATEIPNVLCLLHIFCRSPQQTVMDIGKKYIAPYETMFAYPNDYSAAAYSNAACTFNMCDRIPGGLELSKQCSRKAMQMTMVFYGRHERNSDRDEYLLDTLSQLPPQKSLTECAFCGESPVRAAITLSRCGKCKKVSYCSEGCQKVHWSLHKKTCKVQK